MAGKTSNTDSAEAAGSRGTRKRRSLEKLPHSTGRTEERGLGLGSVREIATGGLAATWNASQASVERGAALLPGWLRRLGYYGLALLFVAAAAVLRWALSDALSPAPTLVFYLAWVGAAAFGGLGPGLLATVASWVCIEFLFDSTPDEIGLTDPMSMARLMILLVGGLAVSLVGEKMRRSRIRERRQGRKLADLAQLTNLGPLLILDSQDRIISWSDGCTRLYGFTPEQAIGRVSHELLRTRFPQPLEAIHAILHETGRWEGELIHRRADGTSVNIASLRVLRDGTSKPAVLEIGNDITDRKQAEEALRESEERARQRAAELATVLEAVPTPVIIVHDPDGVHMTGNQAADKLLRHPRGAEISLSAPPETKPRHFKAVKDGRELRPDELPAQRAARGLQVQDFEFSLVFDDGATRSVVGYGTPLRDDQGRPRGAVHVLVDITERKQAEEALRERMKELRCLYAVDRDLQEDLSVDELCRRAVEHLVPAMQFPEITVSVIELKGKRFTSENYAEGLPHALHAAIRVEGEVLGHLGVYYTEERPFTIPEEQDLVNGVAEAVGTWLEHKQAEEALRESEEKYRRIVETATEGIVMVDANARVVFANDRWSDIFGYSLEEARHMTHFDMVFPEDMARMRERWESRKRGVKESYEFRFRRKDGSPIWVLIGVAPMFDPEGKFLGTLVMAADITERKRAEEALRELTATLESKVAQRTAELRDRAKQLQKLTLDLSEAEGRERKRLAGILHDDLQQTLAAAKFHLGLVSNRCKDDETLQEMTGKVEELLVEAIDKSRSLSRELSPPGLARSDLRETFEWLADQVQAKHGLTVHVDVRDQIELQSEPLKALLYKAAQEMLFNVVKHAQVREARLRLRRRRGNICLAVSDKGQGFDPQGLGSASGFGLLNIRERVNLLGGCMKVRSAKGKGSTFLILVPDSAQQANQIDRA